MLGDLEFLCDSVYVAMAVVHAVTLILGVLGNGVVIWIAGFKVKKSVSTIWYLSLAVSDFLFCTSVAPILTYILKDEWIFGSFMCKFTFYFQYFNMYNSVFLLVIISVDRCVVVKFPVWAKNKRTKCKALVVVLLTSIISAALSTPYALVPYIDSMSIMTFFYRRTFCVFNHSGRSTATAISLICGFVIPFLIIISCLVIIDQTKKNQNAQDQTSVKVIKILSVVFVICFLLFQTLDLEAVIRVLIVSLALYNAFFFVKPLIYVIVGRNLKTQCCAPCSKIQNAIEDCDHGGGEEIQGTELSEI